MLPALGRLAACAGLVLLLTACTGPGAPSGSSSPAPSLPHGSSSRPGPSDSTPQAPDPGPDTSVIGPGISTPGPDTSEPDPVPAGEPYDFSLPVAEGEKVAADYFDDAAFVGDSRTEGMLLYSGMVHGDKLTSNGMNIFKLEDTKALTIDGEEYTLLEALALKQYGKVYLCLGVNELGYHDDKGFYRNYCQVIDDIRACQPNAVIYVQSLIPLNEQVIADTHGPSYLTNKHLRAYNELIYQAAQDKQVAFLDLYSAFEVDGSLPAEATRDGTHLTTAYCRQWMDYLMSHTVDFDTLYPNGIPETEENET